MLNIKNCLEKFYKELSCAESDKKQISDIIKRHTQTEFSLDKIEIKNHMVSVNASPAILNQIFIYKSKILEDIARLEPGVKVVDIRSL